jgi:hypothetical protein
VVLVSIIRLVKLVHVETRPTFDAGYAGASLHFWTLTEVNTAVSCACLMTLKPLVAHFFPDFFASSSDMSEPTLRQVTERSRHSTGTGRTSRMSFARPGSGMTQCHAMSDIQSPRSAVFPAIDEQDARYSEEAIKNLDVEAQVDESVASTVPDEEAVLPEGTLRPPPPR